MESTNQNKKCVIDIETTSLNPWEGRIICVGIKDVESGETLVFQDDHEYAMLMRFFEYFIRRKFDEIIGFNIDFDLRFLTAKALKYKISSANGFFTATATDVMAILNRYKRLNSTFRWGTLDEWSRFLLGKGKILNGASVPELYRQRRVDEIVKYNENDVEITYELWRCIDAIMGADSHGYN